MSYNYDISPITKVKTIVYCKYKIIIDNVYFGENRADVRIILADETEENIKEFIYEISGVNYLDWGSDSMLREILKQKIRNENF